METPWQKWLAWALVVLAGVALFPLVLAPFEYQASYLVPDDTFYYLEWAQHVVAGDGPTVDGDVATNGFQPLWAVLVVGLATVLREPETLLRGMLALGLLWNVVAGCALARAAHYLGGSGAALAAGTLFACFLLRTRGVHLSGMEISLSLAISALLMLALIALWQRGQWHGPWNPITLGFLLGAFLLVRVDNVLYLPIPVIVEVVQRLRGRRGLFPYVGSRDVALMAGPVFALTAPYLLWNKLTFGAWLPSSGAIKLVVTQEEWRLRGVDESTARLAREVVGSAVAQAMRPFAWLSRAVPLLYDLLRKPWLALAVVPALVVVASARPHWRRALGIVVLAAAVLLGRQLVHASGLDRPYLEYAVWYLGLEIIVATLATAWIVHRLLFGLLRTVRSLPPNAKIGFHAVVMLLLLVRISMGEAGDLLPGRLATVPPNATYRTAEQAVEWLQEGVGANAVVGSFSSGLLQFLSARPILNLDGRVDDGELARRLNQGEEILPYVHSRGTTHMIDRIYPGDGYFRRFWDQAMQQGQLLARFSEEGAMDVLVVRLPDQHGAASP